MDLIVSLLLDLIATVTFEPDCNCYFRDESDYNSYFRI